MLQSCNVPFCKKLTNTQGCVSSSVIVMERPCVGFFHTTSLPMKSSSQIILTVDDLHAPVVSHDRCCHQSCLSPACQIFDRPHILLDPLEIVCAIQKHELSTLFPLCKLAIAAQNILKMSYQAWLKFQINSLLHRTHV